MDSFHDYIDVHHFSGSYVHLGDGHGGIFEG